MRASAGPGSAHSGSGQGLPRRSIQRGPAEFVFVVPALSGPYDLGNAVVRAAIAVDPTTAR